MQERGRAIMRRLSAPPRLSPRVSAVPRIGLRQLLIGLSLAGIVPIAIVATVLLVALWRAQQAELQESMRATAHALAVSVEQRVESTQRRLESLARLEAASGPEALVRRTTAILAASPDWSGLVVMTPADARLPHHSELLAGKAAVAGLEIGVPVIDNGKVAYGLIATLDARELSALLRAQLRDASRVAGIADGERRIVARTRDPEHYVGKPLIAPLEAAVRESASGLRRFPVYDGPDVYSAWTPIHGTRWTLILGTPAASADAALSRSLGAFAALLAVVLVASGVFAWLIGRRLADSIHAAAEAAAVMSAGRPARRVASGSGEAQRW